jgi:hypothetical protein
MRAQSWILVSILGLAGCGAHSGVQEDDRPIQPLEEEGSGSLDLSTWELDFGSVALGEQATRVAVLGNVGDELRR